MIDAFTKIRLDDDEHPLLKSCRRFTLDEDGDAGKEAIGFLTSSSQVPADVAQRCMSLLLKISPTKHHDIRDGALSGLLRQSNAAKAMLAERLQDKTTTAAFEEIYTIGDGAATGIANVVLTPEAWKSEEARDACEKDVFRLYMAKLLEVGDDDDSRAMRGISRLLVTDAAKLHDLVDDDTFDAILSCLDYRNPIETKSPATLSTAKFLEASGDKGQSMLTTYVIKHYSLQTTEDLVLAFSAEAAIFPIATATAASMFLTKDFLPSLVPLLELKVKSRHVGLAALEMLSAACVDTACREAIQKHCLEWIQEASKADEAQKSTIAAVVLAKVHGTSVKVNGHSPDEKNEHNYSDEIVRKLMQLLRDNPKDNRASVFEGLAHQSSRPRVKESLIKDREWLQLFIRELGHADPVSLAIFGGLSIVEHLVTYLPNLSDEQKKIAQLKAYANAQGKTAQSDPLNEDDAVSRRCQILVIAELVPALEGIYKQVRVGSLAIIIRIVLSLAKMPSKRRVIMVQQGALKMLIRSLEKLGDMDAQNADAKKNAAQAIARLLISVDPSIVFGPSKNASVMSVIPPLVSLLDDDEALALDSPRDLLPTYEGLLALTNLASVPTNGATESIVRLCRARIEELLLSNNSRIQTAVTELVCNLVQQSAGIEMFANGTPEAAKLVHIFLALAGSESLPTRSAAAGTLATLTEFAEVIDAINKQERGMELLLAILEDDEQGMLHRGIFAIVNICHCDKEAATLARARMKELDIEGKLEMAKRKADSEDVYVLFEEAEKALGISFYQQQ